MLFRRLCLVEVQAFYSSCRFHFLSYYQNLWESEDYYCTQLTSMEEKLSALEALGVCKGLTSTKLWNVHSKSVQVKSNIPDTQTASLSFQTSANNVIKSLEKGNSLMISQNFERWNDPRSHRVKETIREETKQDIPIKSCREMETEKSEFNIPENDKQSKMNSSCDEAFLESKGKAEELLKYAEIKRAEATLNKKHSLDETSEEIESSESEEVNHEIAKNKTVLEWVNHLPLKNGVYPKENVSELKEENQAIPSSEDRPLVRAELSREASLQSSSSLDSILDSRRPDPVEIFLNLGFGGLPGIDTENCRIPKRFLVPSKCKGGDWNEFLNRELIQAQNFECSSLGFRGLSGPSYRRPSAIVANIMEKLRERAVPQPHGRSRFSTVAKMVLNEKSVLNKLTPEFQSVLSPDSRRFLQNQGKKSPEVPRRRIIFGQKSFAFAHDGEFVEVESSNIEEKTTKEPTTTLAPSDSEEPKVYTSPEVLLKLRRSSFQKQKKIEEDTDVDDVFYVLGNEERPTELSYNKNNDDDNNNNKNNNNNINNNNNNNECSKKAGKIPRRFLSSGNLKGLEENNLSETIRLEVEKEILGLSQKIKNMNSQDLSSMLKQVKELRSKFENNGQESSGM